MTQSLVQVQVLVLVDSWPLWRQMSVMVQTCCSSFTFYHLLMQEGRGYGRG